MKFLACFALLLTSFNLPGQTTVFVAAKSGISLRSQPSVSGALVTKLPYAEKLNLLETNPEPFTIEGFNTNWIKVTNGKNTGWIVAVFTLPFQPPKEGVASFENWFRQIGSVAGTFKSLQKPGDGYATTMVKTLYSNGTELWQMQAVEDIATTVILPGCTIEQAFHLLRLINEFGAIIKPDQPFPPGDSNQQPDTGNTAIHLLLEKNETTGKPAVQKLRIERTEGSVETLEIFLLNGQAVISYSAGV